MKLKNKFFMVIFSALIVVMFSSCVDVVQIIDLNGDKYVCKFRCTISKPLMAMADADVDDFLEEFDADDFPKGVSVKTIDTQYEVGYDIGFSINQKTTDDDEQKMLPEVLSNGNIKIPLFMSDEFVDSMNESKNASAEAMASAILSSAKWKIYVAKKIVPTISNTYIKNKYSSVNVSFFEIGNFYCIEIPFPEVKKGSSLIVEK